MNTLVSKSLTVLADRMLKNALRNKSIFKNYIDMFFNKNWSDNRYILGKHSPLNSFGISILNDRVALCLLKELIEKRRWPQYMIIKILRTITIPNAIFKRAINKKFTLYGRDRDLVTDWFEIFCWLRKPKFMKYMCSKGIVRYFREDNYINNRYYTYTFELDDGIYNKIITIDNPITLEIDNRWKEKNIALNRFRVSYEKEKLVIRKASDTIVLQKKLINMILQTFTSRNLSKIVLYY